MNFHTPGIGVRIWRVGNVVPRAGVPSSLLAATLLVCQVATPALAQLSQGTGGGGVPSLFGQRTLGTASGPGRGLLGSSGGPGQALSQSGNLLTGNERFLRGNQQGRFVGRDAAEVNELFRSLTGGLSDNRGSGPARFDPGTRGRSRSQRRFGPGGGRGSAASSAVRRPRTRLQVAFAHRSPQSVATVENLRSRLNGTLGQRATGLVIDLELRERTLILRGTVASEDDRALAERLARLEPGVSHVENRLRVADGPSDRAPQ